MATVAFIEMCVRDYLCDFEAGSRFCPPVCVCVFRSHLPDGSEGWTKS